MALARREIPSAADDLDTYLAVMNEVRAKISADFAAFSLTAFNEAGTTDGGPGGSGVSGVDSKTADLLRSALANVAEDRAMREEAQAAARRILDGNAGRLSESQLRAIFTHLNTCRGKNGNKVFTRFAPQFSGWNANVIVSALDRLNPLVEAMWKAPDDESTLEALERFFAADISNAGIGFPTAVLFLKDPERYPVWFRSFDRTVRKLWNAPAARNRKSALDYAEYRRHVDRMRTEFNVPAGLHDLALFYLDSIAKGGGTSAGGPAPSPEKGDEASVNTDALAAELAMPPELVDRIATRVLQDGQVILTGPPGTGKTELALRLAKLLAGDPSRVDKVQFHPSYGYEEFIEGLRPVVHGGHLQYEIVPGIFRRLCDRARAAPKQHHVLVVDEINRGNLPRVFGELLMLLERRGETVTLPLSRESFSNPPNVSLIGTMNSADRSVALFDLALRRRFHFFELAPDEAILRTWLVRKGQSEDVADLFETLNRELTRAGVERDRLVGHSYFMRIPLDDAALEDLWETAILPLLRELFFADPARVDEFDLERIRERLPTESTP